MNVIYTRNDIFCAEPEREMGDVSMQIKTTVGESRVGRANYKDFSSVGEKKQVSTKGDYCQSREQEQINERFEEEEKDNQVVCEEVDEKVSFNFEEKKKEEEIIIRHLEEKLIFLSSLENDNQLENKHSKPKEVITMIKSMKRKSSKNPIRMCHLHRQLLTWSLLLVAISTVVLAINEFQIDQIAFQATRLNGSSSSSRSNLSNSTAKASHLSWRPQLISITSPKETQIADQSSLNSLHLSRRQSGIQPAEGSSKFIRTNELDVFLDDMDHNEVRSVASGLPIMEGDIFRPKPIVGNNNNNQHKDKAASIRLVGMQSVVTAPIIPAPPQQTSGRLDEGASERQIYSECALILQRTYVKNIDDPKHQLVPFGKTEQACISYKHIDKAIEQAKHNLKFRDLNKQRKRQRQPSSQQVAPFTRPPPPPPPFEVIHSSLEPPEDLVAAIGEINMATTQIIADQFDLSNDELLNGLPLIDMSKTKFWSICPLLVKQDIKCQLTRFRTFTGHCNNLKHPTWGAAMTPFARYLPPVHPDGIWIPRKSTVSEHLVELNSVGGHNSAIASAPEPSFARDFYDSGDFHHHHHDINRRQLGEGLSEASSVRFESRLKPEASSDNSLNSILNALEGASSVIQQSSSSHLHHSRKRLNHQELPSARLITSIVHRDMDIPAHDFSILFMSWGQMLDHDMTRAAQPPSSIKCCGSNNNEPKHKLCLPIQVPPGDPLYSKFNVQCLEFRRSLAGVRPNCVLGPRVHQNAITAPIDANFVYGSSRAHSDSLRLFKGGRLRDRDWFRQEGLKPLLPAQDVNPDLECIARPQDLFCFLAGDVRANEQTHLTVLHTLYMREHNRMADKLAELNPHWDDERIFQESRHIMAAGVQQVMINEYIPLLIGKKMSELYNLTASHSNSKHYWHGYDPSVTTSVSNSFAAAAFRQGHTFVQGTVERYNKFHEFVTSERLRHLFKQPFLMYKPGVMDELVSGMINQASQSYDPFVSEDISGHLFQQPDAKIGHDLPAINLQRGREQGLPGYNLFREWCGLPRAETFEQLEPYLTNHTAFHYSRLYKHVDDIDLWSGGVSERKLPGAAIGPTFACIIARQFSNTRRGDRFWFENPNLPSSFTPEQLAEIRKISLAKILCANSDDLPTIQRWALRMPHPVLNPRVACEQLPEIELQYWQEE